MKKIMLLLALCLSFAATAQKKTTTTQKKTVTDYCSQIEIQEGKPEGETHYVTPTVDGISIKKIKRTGSQIFICTIKIVSKTKQQGTFATIMFDNIKSIDKPNAKIIEGVQTDNSFEYFAMFKIEEDEINLFKESTVKGLMLMDEIVLAKQKEKLQKIVTCLINK